MLRRIISVINQARQGVYYEAYSLRKNADPDDYFTAVMVVGAIDAGMLSGALFLVAGYFSAQEAISILIPDTMLITSMHELYAVLMLGVYVFGIEALYFRFLSPPREIVRTIDSLSVGERARIRTMGLFCAFIAMVGGAIFAILA